METTDYINFDYTKWRRRVFDDVDAAAFNDAAVAYENEHPFQLKKAQIPIDGIK